MATPENIAEEFTGEEEGGCYHLALGAFGAALVVGALEKRFLGTEKVHTLIWGNQKEQSLQNVTFNQEDLADSIQRYSKFLTTQYDNSPKTTIPQSVINSEATTLVTQLEQDVQELLDQSQFTQALSAIRTAESKSEGIKTSQFVYPQIAQTEAEIYQTIADHVQTPQAKNYWRTQAIDLFTIAHQFDQTANQEIAQNPLTVMLLLSQMDQQKLYSQIQQA